MKTIKDYFSIKELVDSRIYKMYGESSWRFLDQKLLDTLLFIREELNQPITVNNWSWGGKFEQRGLRHNKSPMVTKKTRPYLSAHMFGKAVDFDVKGMEADEVRMWLIANSDRLPHPIRLERLMNGKPISWVHLDVLKMMDQDKVYIFDV